MDPVVDPSYYQPSPGTLSGFQNTDLLNTHPDIAKTGWSIEKVRQFLLNEAEDSFPSPERLRELADVIDAHLEDFDNPHKVTLDQVSGNIVKDVIGNIVPGTVPPIAPFYGFDATAGMPMETIFPASYTVTNAYRMLSSGALTDTNSEPELIASDFLYGRAGFPMFASVTNVVPNNWFTNSNLRINTQIVDVSTTAINLPFDFRRVDETNATGRFGVSIPFAATPNNLYSFTVFVLPIYPIGSYIVSPAGNSENAMVVDIETGEYSFTSDEVSGGVQVYPNGLLKIDFCFRTDGSPAGRVDLVHKRPDDETPVRVGVEGQMLFLFTNPLAASQTAPCYPVPLDRSVALTNSPLRLQLNRVKAPNSITNMMVRLETFLKPVPGNANISTQTLFSFDKLTVTRDNKQVYVKNNGQTLFTSTILDGLNVFSISWSNTEILFKDLATHKKRVVGSFGGLSTANVFAGPFGGYLNSVFLYGDKDRDQCLEFLTNG